MHAHHVVSLWSSGSCHSKERGCLAESHAPSEGKQTASIHNLLLLCHYADYAFKFGHICNGRRRRNWTVYGQEHTVGRYLDSLIHERPPLPAAWWLWWVTAGWWLYVEIRRLPGCCWEWPCGGPGPHTCWAGGCLDGHSTGPAGRNESVKTL